MTAAATEGRRAVVAGWRLIRHELARERAGLPGLFGWSLLAALPALLSGRLVAFAVDDGFLAGRPATGAAWLAGYALAVLVGALGARQVPGRVGGVVESLRDRLVAVVVRDTVHGAARGGSRPDAGAVSRLVGQVETVRDTAAGALVGVQQVVLAVVAAAIGLFWLAPVVAVLVIAPVLLAVLILLASLPAMVTRQQAVLAADEQVAAMVGRLTETVRDVVACGGQPRARHEIGLAVDRQAEAAQAAARTASARSLVTAVGGHLPLVLLLFAAPALIGSGQLTAGGLLGAVTYISSSLWPALGAAARTIAGAGTQLAVTLDRLRPEVEPEPEVRSVEEHSGPRCPVGTDLVTRELTFAYGPHADPIVDGLELQVPAGEQLAVVGASGIGKSTLLGILAGLTDPDSGTVTIGGTDPARAQTRERSALVLLVPQEAYVFTGTLRENLCYFAPHARDADLDRAVAAIGLDDLLGAPGGYDRIVGPALSAGERQLVCLARTWLSPAPVVLLDEATCHLHPAAQVRAENAFRERGGTVIVVAHRMTSAQRADRVLLMGDAGTLIGSHQELLMRSPHYAALAGQWSLPSGDQENQEVAR